MNAVLILFIILLLSIHVMKLLKDAAKGNIDITEFVLIIGSYLLFVTILLYVGYNFG